MVNILVQHHCINFFFFLGTLCKTFSKSLTCFWFRNNHAQKSSKLANWHLKQNCANVFYRFALSITNMASYSVMCITFPLSCANLSQAHFSCSSPWRPGMRHYGAAHSFICDCAPLASGSSVCTCSYGRMSSYRQPCCGVLSQWHHMTGRCFHLILLV